MIRAPKRPSHSLFAALFLLFAHRKTSLRLPGQLHNWKIEAFNSSKKHALMPLLFCLSPGFLEEAVSSSKAWPSCKQEKRESQLPLVCSASRTAHTPTKRKAFSFCEWPCLASRLSHAGGSLRPPHGSLTLRWVKLRICNRWVDFCPPNHLQCPWNENRPETQQGSHD